MTLPVYMCVKLTIRDLYHDSYPPHPTISYTCGVTIVAGVRGGAIKSFEVLIIIATIVNVIQHKNKNKKKKNKKKTKTKTKNKKKKN